jgi:hypothetical protein
LLHQVIEAAGVQLSVAVGNVQVAVCIHVVLPKPVFTVTLAGQPAMIGFVLSTTITVNIQVSLAFATAAASIATYFTTVEPTGKLAPGL